VLVVESEDLMMKAATEEKDDHRLAPVPNLDAEETGFESIGVLVRRWLERHRPQRGTPTPQSGRNRENPTGSRVER
jgi:hypothetical protein